MSANHIHNRIARNDTDGINFYKNPVARLAINLRDDCKCIYCGAYCLGNSSLEHLSCQSHGGGHDATNLVVACLSCNSARGNRSLVTFAAAKGLNLARVVAEIIERVNRPVLPHLERALIVARPATAKRIGLAA